MTPEEWTSALEAGQVPGAVLLAGEEPLLRDDALAAVRSAVLDPAAEDFNLDRLDGSQTTPAALAEAVQMLPVMAPRRLVVLDEPEGRRGGGRALADTLAELVPAQIDGSQTVLVVRAAKADKRARWVKAFGAAIVVCDAPRRTREVAAFVRTEARRQEVELERGVAEALAERIGPQLLLLRQEIAKLALLAGPGSPVSRAHVSAGTIDAAEEPIWDLTDAIGEGRTPDALRMLSRLLSAGAPPPVILGSLVSHFRRLTRVGFGESVAGPPFVRKKLESQSRRYGPRRLRSALAAIHETDLALKGAGALGPELALERLVIALAS